MLFPFVWTNKTLQMKLIEEKKMKKVKLESTKQSSIKGELHFFWSYDNLRGLVWYKTSDMLFPFI